MSVVIGSVDFADFTQYYNKAYRDRPRLSMPSREVVVAARIAKSGPALDIGCGRGEDALFLARQGFDVKAIDLSRVAIDNLLKAAESCGRKIDAVAGNIMHELLLDEYMLIVNRYMLDHLTEGDALWLVRRMQEKTAPGGVNVVVTFIDARGIQPLMREIVHQPRYCFEVGELPRLYDGWEILMSEIATDKEMLKGEKIIRLVARKRH